MALVTCPDCGNSVSDQAVACPKCARPINRQTAAETPRTNRLESVGAKIAIVALSLGYFVGKFARIEAGMLVAALMLVVGIALFISGRL
jgi:hypothetical protein